MHSYLRVYLQTAYIVRKRYIKDLRKNCRFVWSHWRGGRKGRQRVRTGNKRPEKVLCSLYHVTPALHKHIGSTKPRRENKNRTDRRTVAYIHLYYIVCVCARLSVVFSLDLSLVFFFPSLLFLFLYIYTIHVFYTYIHVHTYTGAKRVSYFYDARKHTHTHL